MIDQTEIRHRAMDNLLPAWIEGRRSVAVLQSDVEESRAQHKEAKEALGKVEQNLEHVAGCRILACKLCSEIAANGTTKIV